MKVNFLHITLFSLLYLIYDISFLESNALEAGLNNEEYVSTDDVHRANKFWILANETLDKVSTKIETENGDDPNGYQCPIFAKKLLADCKKMPMWSSVVRDHFGHGRVPASSGIVESDFNNFKTRLLNKNRSMRVDDLVNRHLNFICGTSNIIQGEWVQKSNELHAPEIEKGNVIAHYNIPPEGI